MDKANNNNYHNFIWLFISLIFVNLQNWSFYNNLSILIYNIFSFFFTEESGEKTSDTTLTILFMTK